MKRLCGLAVIGLWACNSGGGGGARIGSDPQQTELPRVEVKLPPPPSFQKDHPAEKYPDASYSVYGVRKTPKTTLNTEVRVKGFITEVYECPPCPKGNTCKPCDKPHFWLSDRANGPKDKALMVTDHPTEQPKTKKKIKFEVGGQYYVVGTFAKASATGFSSSDGLLVFRSATKVGEDTPVAQVDRPVQ
ncbi:MAG: hypothetical protein IT371_17615 [Deltaproteobacteria bacterium]|nr:hypothetical protein [Deltaproteobacteria bacterium]